MGLIPRRRRNQPGRLVGDLFSAIATSPLPEKSETKEKTYNEEDENDKGIEVNEKVQNPFKHDVASRELRGDGYAVQPIPSRANWNRAGGTASLYRVLLERTFPIRTEVSVQSTENNPRGLHAPRGIRTPILSPSARWLTS